MSFCCTSSTNVCAWEGRLDLIEEYCRHDVEITRDLYRHVLKEGHLVFDRKGERLRVPIAWDLEALARSSEPDAR